MTEFTPWLALTGGILIGISAVLLMLFHGRVAGMTGILTGILPPHSKDWAWRVAFLIGAISAPSLFIFFGGHIPFNVPPPQWLLIVGGLIVGIGVTFGSGCTSGHGVCGLARFSKRSLVATIVFMATAFLTVYVIRHILFIA